MRRSAHIPTTIRKRRGVSALYTIVILVALCGLVSLGVDIGHVHVAKSELQTAADAAARAAAAALPGGASDAIAAATAAAADNHCDGASIVLNPAEDVEFGTWDSETKTFTPLSDSDGANAMRITARRVASRNTAIPLSFARVVGKSTCDVRATAIAKVTVGSGGGFIGLNGIDFKNNAFVGSYNSSWTQIPFQAGAYRHAKLGTNGVLSVRRNAVVMGDVELGPSGSVDGDPFVSGTTRHLPSPLTAPELPAWTPALNPGGVSANYTVNRNTTLPGGDYWFTSLTVNARLSFSGPATVHVNGNIALDGSLIASDFRPTNLTVYQLGSNRTFGDSKSNSMLIIANVIAPGADFSAKNNFLFAGAGVFGTITAKNNAAMFYDEAMSGSGGGARTISLVK